MDHAPRILGGDDRGRRLSAPAGRGTRPILALLKTRLFDILGQRLDELHVWDVFAGSGALGLEALSRGAASCVLFDRDRLALDCLRDNVAALGYENRARVVGLDVFRVAWSDLDPPADLCFFDPPFPLVARDPGKLAAVVDTIVASLAPEGRLVYRTPSREAAPPTPGGCELVDRREHGENVLSIYRASG